jgi:hypothetical protein
MPFLLPTMPTDALRLVLDAAGAECRHPVRATCRAFRDAAPDARRGDHAALVEAAARAGSTSLIFWAVRECRHPGPLACAASARAGRLPLLQALRAEHVAWDARTYRAAGPHADVRVWVHEHGCPRPVVLTKLDGSAPMAAADLPETVRAWAAPRVAALAYLPMGGEGLRYRFVRRYVSRIGRHPLWQVVTAGSGFRDLGRTDDEALAAVLAAACLADAHRLTSRRAVHAWAWEACHDPVTFDAWLHDPERVDVTNAAPG